VFNAFKATGDADDVATTFGVSRAWVHRLVQHERETGSLAPRKQTTFRPRVLAGQEATLRALVAAQPDATLAELRERVPSRPALSTLWTELDPYTPPNSVALTSSPRGDAGRTRWRSTMPRSTCSSMNQA
jgi:hypothetical protein